MNPLEKAIEDSGADDDSGPDDDAGSDYDGASEKLGHVSISNRDLSDKVKSSNLKVMEKSL